MMNSFAQIQAKFQALGPFLDEKTTRLWAATEAQALGWGGVTAVAQATGLSRATIHTGQAELHGTQGTPPLVRVRHPGGGRKSLCATQPGLAQALEALVEPLTRGDPMSPLRWTCKSTARLAAELQAQGYEVGTRTVAVLLKDLHYSLQSQRKSKELAQHPDRNAQFEYLNGRAAWFQQRGQPVLSVDAKKKELLGAFKQTGREWQPTGQPEVVSGHDFPDKELGKAIPYGVYDVRRNEGWVSVGIDHDTAAFAVASLRQWWLEMGQTSYPEAREVLLLADGGGSNGSRTRLWKKELQCLADETGLTLEVCHFPPGTSKWNKIEHRMFAHITQNWRGRALLTKEIVVALIGATTTSQGLKIRAGLNEGKYPTKLKVSDEEMEELRLERAEFHGEWNYRLLPRLQN